MYEQVKQHNIGVTQRMNEYKSSILAMVKFE